MLRGREGWEGEWRDGEGRKDKGREGKKREGAEGGMRVWKEEQGLTWIFVQGH